MTEGGLRLIIERLREYPEEYRKFKEDLEVYVDLKCSIDESYRDSLRMEEVVKNFILGNSLGAENERTKRSLMILGLAGAGKSLFIRKLHLKLLFEEQLETASTPAIFKVTLREWVGRDT